jgi:hypothetical protein
MITPAAAGPEPQAIGPWAERRRAIRRRRVAELALLATAFILAFVALAGPAILVVR